MALTAAFLERPRDLQFKLIPNTIGTIFGRWPYAPVVAEPQNTLLTEDSYVDTSAILTVIWYTYRNKGSLKFSALARVIIAEATIYFIIMLAAQIYIQISFNLIKVGLSIPAPLRGDNVRLLQGQQLPLL